MGRIQSSVGLITGIPIADTVEQLLAISAQPRDLLVQRTARLQSQQVAIGALTAQVIGVDLAVRQLANPSLFQRREVSSSDDTILSVTTTGDPGVGTHRFTPVRLAQAHQVLSSGFASNDEPLGGGELSIAFGGFLDRGLSLDEVNDGAGVQRGEIRITDRSGSSAIINLRLAQNVDDVIRAINSSSDINVTASAVGDRFALVDNTGQSSSNLKVQEVGLSTTASDLGLAGIDVASDSAIGSDIVSLHDDLALAGFNDGNGVALRRGVADLEISLRDGSTLQVEFQAQAKGLTQSSATTEAAAGIDAAVTITSVGIGEAFDGYEIIFENDDDTTVGQESVTVDTLSKTIKFKIDEGRTTAADIVRTLNNDSVASQLFTAAAAPGGNGTGVVDPVDTATTSGGAVAYNNERTLGELLETINAADPARLQAQISSSGDAIELVDLTSGAGTFSVASASGGSVAEDLGLSVAAVGGTITSERRLSGLKTVLLDTLNGGSGIGSLGLLSLTDRAGASASVDLGSAETLDDIISSINAAGVGITARINRVRNGLELVDTTGGAGPLTVSNGDSTNTADSLGIAIDAAVDQIDSGSLKLQVFHEQLTLASLNHGEGVGNGSFLITDSTGQSGAVNLQTSQAETVGDVIDLINGLAIGVEARINGAGDGLLLVDTAGGTGDLSVADVGNGTAASDLRIAGTSTTVQVGGSPEKAIEGSTAIRIELGADDTLQDLVDKINELEANVSASLFNSGTGTKPYRLSLTSQITGSAGELLIDGTAINTDFQAVVAAQDSLLVVGSIDGPVAGAFAVSSSNTFDGIINGVSLTINQTSLDPVTISIEETEDPIITQLGVFVGQYNSLRDKVDELTFFDEVENSTGVLFGSTEALRIEFDMANLISGRVFGAGAIQSLEEVGLSLDRDGRLEFDEQRFRDRYAENPDDVEQFFTQAETGVAARFLNIADQLAGAENSLLINRTQSLNDSIELNNQRIADFSDALDRERESLITEFAQLESVISRLQANLSAISQIQPIAPLITR